MPTIYMMMTVANIWSVRTITSDITSDVCHVTSHCHICHVTLTYWNWYIFVASVISSKGSLSAYMMVWRSTSEVSGTNPFPPPSPPSLIIMWSIMWPLTLDWTTFSLLLFCSQFEYQQGKLEAEVENLSWKIQKAEITDRGVSLLVTYWFFLILHTEVVSPGQQKNKLT